MNKMLVYEPGWSKEQQEEATAAALRRFPDKCERQLKRDGTGRIFCQPPDCPHCGRERNECPETQGASCRQFKLAQSVLTKGAFV